MPVPASSWGSSNEVELSTETGPRARANEKIIMPMAGVTHVYASRIMDVIRINVAKNTRQCTRAVRPMPPHLRGPCIYYLQLVRRLPYLWTTTPIIGATTIGTTWVKLLWYCIMWGQFIYEGSRGWFALHNTYTSHDTCGIVSELYIFTIHINISLYCVLLLWIRPCTCVATSSKLLITLDMMNWIHGIIQKVLGM